jgi:hypothetical protein
VSKIFNQFCQTTSQFNPNQSNPIQSQSNQQNHENEPVKIILPFHVLSAILLLLLTLSLGSCELFDKHKHPEPTPVPEPTQPNKPNPDPLAKFRPKW